MNDGFLIAAIAMLIATIPCGIVVLRAQLMSAVVAYEAISSIIVMVLVLLAEGFGRSGEFELPVLLALLLFGSGLVFVRVLERWPGPAGRRAARPGRGDRAGLLDRPAGDARRLSETEFRDADRAGGPADRL